VDVAIGNEIFLVGSYIDHIMIVWYYARICMQWSWWTWRFAVLYI